MYFHYLALLETSPSPHQRHRLGLEAGFSSCAYEGNCCGFVFTKGRVKGASQGVRSGSYLQQFNTKGSLNPVCSRLRAGSQSSSCDSSERINRMETWAFHLLRMLLLLYTLMTHIWMARSCKAAFLGLAVKDCSVSASNKGIQPLRGKPVHLDHGSTLYLYATVLYYSGAELWT